MYIYIYILGCGMQLLKICHTMTTTPFETAHFFSHGAKIYVS